MLGTLAGHGRRASPHPTVRAERRPRAAGGATGSLSHHADPREAVAGARAVYTDVWVSMGDEATAAERRAALAGYRVDDALLDAAAPGAFAMHDLPAHPGEEISAEVLYGSRQRIWDQAENRRHAQKALLELLVAEARAMIATDAPGVVAPRPQRGDELELEIDSLAFGGEGVARLGDGGYVVFVAGAHPRRPRARGRAQRKRSYAHARTLEVLEPSRERLAPVADHPGAPWQVIPYERQLEVKHAQVDEALRRIGRLDGFELQDDRSRRRSPGATATSSSTPSATDAAAATPTRAAFTPRRAPIRW